MDQEIKKLEQLKQQEILLMQQIYEKKINYLNTKIQLLTEESKQKDFDLLNLKKNDLSSDILFQKPIKIQKAQIQILKNKN
ncbi:unnamed protein product [Paramecium sonneborni]|uniref:Uncharacterized protein n=1 Tax=Paramecium sonneborni TaxID=65129 RepID=A0A8S1R399_9CILI|nr:unnamed protein product [Paramecium sonneborni]CAD8122526.1 unnamed protein product [Paramecium sonneborni]